LLDSGSFLNCLNKWTARPQILKRKDTLYWPPYVFIEGSFIRRDFFHDRNNYPRDSSERPGYRRACRHRGCPRPLGALGRMGGSEAARAVRRIIGDRIMQGPGLITALNTAAQLGVALPGNIVTPCRRFHSRDIASRARCDTMSAVEEMAVEF
jgi:hypothetical protein